MSSSLPILRERVEELLQRGMPLDLIERELIDREELDEEQRSALWLYAWTLARRSEAEPTPDPSNSLNLGSSGAVRRLSLIRMLSRVASVAAAVLHLPGV